MARTGGAAGAPFTFLIDDVVRQREVARGLLAEADAVAALLADDTAALGSLEIAFLARLRAHLLDHARALGDNATLTATRAIRALRHEPD